MIAVTLVTCVTSPFANGESDGSNVMDYRDYGEMNEVLTRLAERPHVSVHTIGHSVDYSMSPVSEHPIPAIRIQSNSASQGYRPAILFDGGIHAREWLSSECLLELAEHLSMHGVRPDSEAAAALRNADVWIIPMVNPAGRIIDDPAVSLRVKTGHDFAG